MTRRIVRMVRIATCASFGLTIGLGAVTAQSTPEAGEDVCANPAAGMPEHSGAAMGTPGAGMGAMSGMEMASPAAGMDHAAMDFDQMYIDMMVPHHASILAMAEAALPRLENEPLREIATAIIEAQGSEIDELRGYREQFYGDPEPMPMDDGMMAAMGEMMPSMSGTPEKMAFQMDAAAQVAALCAAQDADLVFIDLTVPHHEMAIGASQDALDRATHPEIRAFAERVITAQQREIDELSAIRRELYGSATPAAMSDARHADSTAAMEGMAIRALTPDEVAQIERGEGAGFALPAELNGVPGPRHVLDLANDLGLSSDQRERVQTVFDVMRSRAIPAGGRYLAAHRALVDGFQNGTLSEATLAANVAEVSRLRGELAVVHLTAHLDTAALLTTEQIAAYERLRRGA